jgi:hypothetical protein
MFPLKEIVEIIKVVTLGGVFIISQRSKYSVEKKLEE